MTQVDFYTHVAAQLPVVASLAAKAVQQGQRVMIYTGDSELSATIDRELWQAPAIGFLPHCMATHALAGQTPVLINDDPALFVHDEVLINLQREIPPYFSRYQRLLEIITLAEEDVAPGRERYSFYKDRGYPLQAHNMQQRKDSR